MARVRDALGGRASRRSEWRALARGVWSVWTVRTYCRCNHLSGRCVLGGLGFELGTNTYIYILLSLRREKIALLPVSGRYLKIRPPRGGGVFKRPINCTRGTVATEPSHLGWATNMHRELRGPRGSCSRIGFARLLPRAVASALCNSRARASSRWPARASVRAASRLVMDSQIFSADDAAAMLPQPAAAATQGATISAEEALKVCAYG